MKHTRKANKKKITRRKKNLVKKHTRKHKRSHRRKVQRGGDPTIDEAIKKLQTFTTQLDKNNKKIDEFTKIDLELAVKLKRLNDTNASLLKLKTIGEDFDLKAKAKIETLEKEIEDIKKSREDMVSKYESRKESFEGNAEKVAKLNSLIKIANEPQEKELSLNDELNKLKNTVVENNNNLNDPKKGTIARLVFVNKGVDEIQKKRKEGDDETMRIISKNLKLDAQIGSFLTDNILLVGRYLFDTPDDDIAISLQQILEKYFNSNSDKYTELETLYRKLVKEKKDEDRRAELAAQRERTALDNATFAEQMNEEAEEEKEEEEKEEGEQSLNVEPKSAINTDHNLGSFGFVLVKKDKGRGKKKGTSPRPPSRNPRLPNPPLPNQLSPNPRLPNPPLPNQLSPKSSKTSDEPTVDETKVDEKKTEQLRSIFPHLAQPVDEESVEPSVVNPVFTQTVETPPEEALTTIVVEVPVVEEIVNSNEEHEFHYTTQGQMPLIFKIQGEVFTELDTINLELLTLFFTTTSIPGFMIPNIRNSGNKILDLIDTLYPRSDNTTYYDCFNINERLFSMFPCFTEFFYIYMFELLGTYFRWFPFYIRDPNILVNLVFRIIVFVFPLKDTMIYKRFFTDELFKMITMYNSQQHIFLQKTYYDFDLYLPDERGAYYQPYNY